MLRARFKNPQTIICIGLICLALGGLSINFLPRHTGLSGNLTDAMSGCLYGIALSTLLIGIRRKQRSRSAGNDQHCA
jgi:hypothetical protein